MPDYDALLVVSFGGPEGPDDVLPFLDNVLRGKPVSDERKREVAEHYRHFGGRSPIGDQCRALVAALEAELRAKGPRLPVYWGNRNWHPMLADTLQKMADDGVKRALAFMTSAYSSYSGCRQYRENVAAARAEVGERAPEVDKLRVFYNHPGFVEPMARNVAAAFARIPEERRARAALAYTAHSIPRGRPRAATTRSSSAKPVAWWGSGWAARTGSSCSRVEAERPASPGSSPTSSPISSALHDAGRRTWWWRPWASSRTTWRCSTTSTTRPRRRRASSAWGSSGAATVGTAPEFVGMIRELVLERMQEAPRRALGERGPNHDVCPEDCCLPGAGRPPSLAPEPAPPAARTASREPRGDDHRAGGGSDDDPVHRLPGLHRPAPAARVSSSFSPRRASPASCRRSSWSWPGTASAPSRRRTRRARGRLELVTGDITRSRPRARARTWPPACTAILRLCYHLAAVYDLAVSAEVGHRINVEGTRHVLDFLGEVKHLARLHYVSTAFVSGTAKGLYRETDLDVGQGWKNHYERTKFEAEVLVAKSGSAEDHLSPRHRGGRLAHRGDGQVRRPVLHPALHGTPALARRLRPARGRPRHRQPGARGLRHRGHGPPRGQPAEPREDVSPDRP